MPIRSEERANADARETALTYGSEAFALAAPCAAMCELVAVRGEDGAAQAAARLADRVAAGEFSELRRH